MRAAIKIVMAVFLLTAMFGCADTPCDGRDVNELPISDNCARWLAGFGGSGSLDPSTTKVVLTSVLTAGGNLAAYGICQRSAKLTPAPASTINDGMYRSTDGAITVALPEPVTQDGQSRIQVWQGNPSGIQKVYFMSSQANEPIYGVYVLRWLFSGAVPKSLSDLDHDMFNTSYYRDSGIVPEDKFEYLYQERFTLDDGTSAIVQVVKPQNPSDEMMSMGGASKQKKESYLIYYLIRPKSVNDTYAVLSIFWRGDCSKCATGPEIDIRNLSPHIAEFVNSFRLAEKNKK